MNEARLTQDLTLHMRGEMRHAEVFKIAEQTRHGYPDIVNTWGGVTSWWEVKFFNEGNFDSPEIQRLTCRRLAQQGICYYVIYELRHGVKRVYIVNPWHLQAWRDSPDFAEGWSHAWVSRFIRHQHELYRPTIAGPR